MMYAAKPCGKPAAGIILPCLLPAGEKNRVMLCAAKVAAVLLFIARWGILHAKGVCHIKAFIPVLVQQIQAFCNGSQQVFAKVGVFGQLLPYILVIAFFPVLPVC